MSRLSNEALDAIQVVDKLDACSLSIVRSGLIANNLRLLTTVTLEREQNERLMQIVITKLLVSPDQQLRDAARMLSQQRLQLHECDADSTLRAIGLQLRSCADNDVKVDLIDFLTGLIESQTWWFAALRAPQLLQVLVVDLCKLSGSELSRTAQLSCHSSLRALQIARDTFLGRFFSVLHAQAPDIASHDPELKHTLHEISASACVEELRLDIVSIASQDEAQADEDLTCSSLDLLKQAVTCSQSACAAVLGSESQCQRLRRLLLGKTNGHARVACLHLLLELWTCVEPEGIEGSLLRYDFATVALEMLTHNAQEVAIHLTLQILEVAMDKAPCQALERSLQVGMHNILAIGPNSTLLGQTDVVLHWYQFIQRTLQSALQPFALDSVVLAVNTGLNVSYDPVLLEATWSTLHLVASDQERLNSCQRAISSSIALSFQVVGKCEARVVSHGTALQSYLQFANTLVASSNACFSWAEDLLGGIDEVIARLISSFDLLSVQTITAMLQLLSTAVQLPGFGTSFATKAASAGFIGICISLLDSSCKGGLEDDAAPESHQRELVHFLRVLLRVLGFASNKDESSSSEGFECFLHASLQDMMVQAAKPSEPDALSCVAAVLAAANVFEDALCNETTTEEWLLAVAQKETLVAELEQHKSTSACLVVLTMILHKKRQTTLPLDFATTLFRFLSVSELTEQPALLSELLTWVWSCYAAQNRHLAIDLMTTTSRSLACEGQLDEATRSMVQAALAQSILDGGDASVCTLVEMLDVGSTPSISDDSTLELLDILQRWTTRPQANPDALFTNGIVPCLYRLLLGEQRGSLLFTRTLELLTRLLWLPSASKNLVSEDYCKKLASECEKELELTLRARAQGQADEQDSCQLCMWLLAAVFAKFVNPVDMDGLVALRKHVEYVLASQTRDERTQSAAILLVMTIAMHVGKTVDNRVSGPSSGFVSMLEWAATTLSSWVPQLLRRVSIFSRIVGILSCRLLASRDSFLRHVSESAASAALKGCVSQAKQDALTTCQQAVIDPDWSVSMKCDVAVETLGDLVRSSNAPKELMGSPWNKVLFQYGLDKVVQARHELEEGKHLAAEFSHWIEFITLTLEFNPSWIPELWTPEHFDALASFTSFSTIAELPRMLRLWRALSSTMPISVQTAESVKVTLTRAFDIAEARHEMGTWLAADRDEFEGSTVTGKDSMVFGCINGLVQSLKGQDQDQGDIANHIVVTMQCLGHAETQLNP